MNRSSPILAIGELVVDWISLEKGKGFKEGNRYQKSLGGNAANVAIGLARLGTASKLLARVGNDVHGEYLLDVLESEGVDTSLVGVDSSAPTAQCFVFTTACEDNTFLNWPPNNAASLLESRHLVELDLSSITAVHATGISLVREPRKTAVIELLEKASASSRLVSFDAGFPTGEGEEVRMSVERLIRLADIVKVNLTELFYWSRQLGKSLSNEDEAIYALYDSPPSSGHESIDRTVLESVTREKIEELARFLYERVEPVVLVVTLAERGSLLIRGEHASWCRSVLVDFVAGVGAGDAFMAGFLHALSVAAEKRLDKNVLGALPDELLDSANRFASIVGALATTNISASEGLPRIEQVERFLNAQLI